MLEKKTSVGLYRREVVGGKEKKKRWIEKIKSVGVYIIEERCTKNRSVGVYRRKMLGRRRRKQKCRSIIIGHRCRTMQNRSVGEKQRRTTLNRVILQLCMHFIMLVSIDMICV